MTDPAWVHLDGEYGPHCLELTESLSADFYTIRRTIYSLSVFVALIPCWVVEELLVNSRRRWSATRFRTKWRQSEDNGLQPQPQICCRVRRYRMVALIGTIRDPYELCRTQSRRPDPRKRPINEFTNIAVYSPTARLPTSRRPDKWTRGQLSTSLSPVTSENKSNPPVITQTRRIKR